MKKIAAILLLSIGISCQNTNKKEAEKSQKNEGTPKFEFQEEFHNFGSLEAGEVVAFSFQFTNIGDGTLVIQKVETDCGCTEVHFPKKGIAPGGSDFIEVVFNSAGETGNTYKEVQVFANTTNGVKKLSIAAKVKNDIINLHSKN